MPITSTINGYSWSVPDGFNRLDLIESLGSLIALAKDWTSISTDSANNPEFWQAAKTSVQAIHDGYEEILSHVFASTTDDAWLATSDLLILLSPPGNTYIFNPSQANRFSIQTQGILWNVWAAWEKYQNAGDPTFNPNNVWNNSWAQGIPPTTPDSSPPPSPSAAAYLRFPSGTPSDSPNFATVPVLADDADPTDTGDWDPPSNTDPFGNETYNPDEKNFRFPVDGIGYPSAADIDTTNSSNTTGLAFRNFLVQSLYDYRSLASEDLNTALGSITGEIPLTAGGDPLPALTIVKRPSLHDSLFFSYALTGEGQLQRQLGLTTDNMRLAEEVLTALNLLNKMLSVGEDVTRKLLRGSSYTDPNNSLWTQRAYFTSGFSMLREIFNSGRITDNIQKNMIQSIIWQGSLAFSAIKKWSATPTNAANRNDADLKLGRWWEGYDKTLTNLRMNSTNNNINNGISQWQNINDTVKQDLKKSLFVYQEFVKSASTLTRKLNQLLLQSAQQIKGR